MTNKKIELLCTAATYVGNRSIQCLDLRGPDQKTLREKYLIGEPRDCPFGTSAEMKRRGFVGIYLKEPSALFRLPRSGRLVFKSC